MKRVQKIAVMVCVAAGIVALAPGARAQDDQRRFDPAQFQERMMERTKETLEIKDDTEWKAVQPLVKKVMDARMAQMGGMGRGMAFGARRPGGDDQNRGGDQQRRMGPPASPEAETLQKAIDGKASNAELKAAVAKYNAARTAKQAELEKAQNDLRKVLTARQEAIATANGLL